MSPNINNWKGFSHKENNRVVHHAKQSVLNAKKQFELLLNSRHDIKGRSASAENLFRRTSFKIRCEPKVEPKTITSTMLWQTFSREYVLNATSIQNPSTQKFSSPHFLTVGYFYFLAGWFSRYFFYLFLLVMKTVGSLIGCFLYYTMVPSLAKLQLCAAVLQNIQNVQVSIYSAYFL